MANLSTNYLGLKLKNPVIVGSSGLTDSVSKIKNIEDSGAGAIVLKSLFEEEIIMEMEETIHAMTNRNFVFPETMDYIETVANDSIISNYINLTVEAKRAVSIPVIASINCVTSQNWTGFAKEIENAGADALELNLFFLPTDNQRGEKELLEETLEIISAVKEIVKIPISLKISPYQSNLTRFAENIDQVGIEGIVLFNRSWMPDIDIHNLVVSSGPILSTPGEIGNTLRWVSILSGRVMCDIAASTGVHDGTGLIKQLLAGAQAVQVVSTIYQHDTGQIQKMVDELTRWMEENEFETIDEFRGRLSRANTGNPAAWERVQFMKHFRNFI